MVGATNATLEPVEEEEEKKEKGRMMTKSMIMMKAFVLRPYLEKKMLTRLFFLFSNDFMTGSGDYIIKK